MKTYLILSIFLALIFTITTEAKECDWELSFNGVGPLKIGMTHDEAEDAIGMPLDLISHGIDEYSLFEPRNCPGSFQVLIWGAPRMGVAVIFAGMVNTIDGIRVGDSEQKVKELRNLLPDHIFLRAPREAGSDPSESRRYLRTSVPFVFDNGKFQNEWKYEINYLTNNGRVTEIKGGV